jgi:hypothetical protein
MQSGLKASLCCLHTLVYVTPQNFNPQLPPKYFKRKVIAVEPSEMTEKSVIQSLCKIASLR